MLFYSLLLGALATILPFIALIGLMAFSGRVAVHSLKLSLWMFLPFAGALGIMLAIRGLGASIEISDAFFGVGAVCLIFILALKSGLSLNGSLATATLVLIVYGLARAELWYTQLSQIHLQALEQTQELMQTSLDQTSREITTSVMKTFWPAYWIISQIVALLIGFILFQRTLGIGIRLKDIRLPYQYNFLLLAFLPLYLFAPARMLFYNGIVALCVLPFFQGLMRLSEHLSRLFGSMIIRIIIMVILLINILTYPIIILFGIADIWTNHLNIKTGGNPA